MPLKHRGASLRSESQVLAASTGRKLSSRSTPGGASSGSIGVASPVPRPRRGAKTTVPVAPENSEEDGLLAAAGSVGIELLAAAGRSKKTGKQLRATVDSTSLAITSSFDDPASKAQHASSKKKAHAPAAAPTATGADPPEVAVGTACDLPSPKRVRRASKQPARPRGGLQDTGEQPKLPNPATPKLNQSAGGHAEDALGQPHPPGSASLKGPTSPTRKWRAAGADAVSEVPTPDVKDRAGPPRRRQARGPVGAGAPAPRLTPEPVVMPVVGGHVLPPVHAWTQESLEAACRHLADQDPVLSELIAEHGAPARLMPKGFDNMFASLARSIVYQQLAGSAASAIYQRFLAVCECEDPVQPAAVVKAPHASLRACGLSERKASYLLDLARHFESGQLSDALIAEFSNEDLVTELTKVKGIGRWTVDMFAMFHLGRPNVLPLGDLGVRKGMTTLYGLKGTPTLEALGCVGAKWEPYRSLGSYYMWQVPTERSSKKVKAAK